MNFVRFLSISSLVFGLGLGAAGANPASDVEARHQFFKSLGAQMKELGGVKASFDADKAKAAAANLAPLLDTDFNTLFAPGTSSADVKGSRAKPEIWQDADAFAKDHDALVAAGRAVIAAADAGDAKAFDAAFTQMGGTCKACHDTFREK